VFNFSPKDQALDLDVPHLDPSGRSMNKILDSSGSRWLGPGSRLPELLEGRREIRVSGFGCGVYASREKEEKP
jgi:hypothetical protein